MHVKSVRQEISLLMLEKNNVLDRWQAAKYEGQLFAYGQANIEISPSIAWVWWSAFFSLKTVPSTQDVFNYIRKRCDEEVSDDILRGRIYQSDLSFLAELFVAYYYLQDGFRVFKVLDFDLKNGIDLLLERASKTITVGVKKSGKISDYYNKKRKDAKNCADCDLFRDSPKPFGSDGLLVPAVHDMEKIKTLMKEQNDF